MRRASSWRRSARRRGVAYWEPINATYGVDIAVVEPELDPTFSFMTVDHDGVIRMDCSSPYAMARLVRLKDQYRVAFGNDPDSRPPRHCHAFGRLDEPESLSCGRDPLPADHRPDVAGAGRDRQDVGQQQMIDRVVNELGRGLL